jgi:hypothetical protein
MVNRERFCDFGMKDREVVVDKARDLMHPGPRSHQIFARRMYDRLVQLSDALHVV